MGTASRKTWLEKQSDEVQLLLLSMDDAGRTVEQMQQALAEKFQIQVPGSTLAHSLARYHDTTGKEEKLAALFATQMDELFQQHPKLDPRMLAKGFITLRLKDALTGKIGADDLFFLAQGEGRLELRERELAVKQEANKLKALQVELERKRVELLERKLPKLKDELEKVVKDEKASKADLQREVRRIYGLLGESAEAVGTAAPLPGAVG